MGSGVFYAWMLHSFGIVGRADNGTQQPHPSPLVAGRDNTVRQATVPPERPILQPGAPPFRLFRVGIDDAGHLVPERQAIASLFLAELRQFSGLAQSRQV